MLKQRIAGLLTRQRNELLSDLSAILQREREAANAALQTRDAAFEQALQTQRHEFHLELEALRAEFQAERAMFQVALEELQHLAREGGSPSGDKARQSIERLARTTDAALVTLVLNSAPATPHNSNISHNPLA